MRLFDPGGSALRGCLIPEQRNVAAKRYSSGDVKMWKIFNTNTEMRKTQGFAKTCKNEEMCKHIKSSMDLDIRGGPPAVPPPRNGGGHISPPRN